MFRLFLFMFLSASSHSYAQDLFSIPVRFETELSSEMFTKKHQDKFEIPRAVVAQDILDVDGNVIITEGSDVVVSVDAKRRKNLARRGKIQITFESTQDIEGRVVLLGAQFEIVGRKKAGFIEQVYSHETEKVMSHSRFGARGLATVAAGGGVIAGAGATAVIATITTMRVKRAFIHYIATAGEAAGRDVANIENVLSKLILNFEKPAQIVKKYGYYFAATTAAVTVGSAATTLVVLASVKGKAAVLEKGTVWNIIVSQDEFNSSDSQS